MTADQTILPSGTDDFRDRRDFNRLDTRGMGLLRIQGEDRPVGNGRIVDISANGLNLLCDASWNDRVEQGARVEVMARLDDPKEPFYLVGDVIWHRPVADEGCQVGIELIAPNPDDTTDRHDDNRDWRALFLA
ncbi:PilZ domain-containing protein [Guyparkeria sp. 1SP6A2]|nr:PilZ domain-containing protein [Guyparkeria sp. 1SP6A2]